MTFLQIKYFVETAKENSYTRTAKNLFVSQQAVSKQIKALEQELGFKLFESEGEKTSAYQRGKKAFCAVGTHAAPDRGCDPGNQKESESERDDPADRTAGV